VAIDYEGTHSHKTITEMGVSTFDARRLFGDPGQTQALPRPEEPQGAIIESHNYHIKNIKLTKRLRFLFGESKR
jgi:hypothetical protein